MDVDLSATVAALAAKFSYNGGDPCLAAPDLAAAVDQLSGIDPAQRDGVVTELIALACKLQRETQPQAATGVAQLLLLAGAVLADMAAASASFEAAGVSTARALETIGAETALKPVAGNAASPSSLFSLRVRKQR